MTNEPLDDLTEHAPVFDGSDANVMTIRRRWDIFCAVVDHFGDIGICWRLARQLSNDHAVDVRLWIDKLDSFACLCPTISTDAAVQSIGSIEIRQWRSNFPNVDAADVVIEAFACELPPAYITAMARRSVAPVWINLEYLSAESWVEDCHQLPSPQSNLSLKKYFYFPGFTIKTGGLLRERDLLAARAAFSQTDIQDLWRRLKVPRSAENRSYETDAMNHARELRVSLFCYENPALPELLECWANRPNPIRLLATPGPATDQISRWLGTQLVPGIPHQRDSLIVQALPFLSQSDYDRLLWACDLNFVRGEDSFVRAQWAQNPFVWQIYPQSEQAHLVKLEAFLSRFLGESTDLDVVRRFWLAWNGVCEIGSSWRDFVANRDLIAERGKVWASELDQAGNLADNLVRFVCGK